MASERHARPAEPSCRLESCATIHSLTKPMGRRFARNGVAPDSRTLRTNRSRRPRPRFSDNAASALSGFVVHIALTIAWGPAVVEPTAGVTGEAGARRTAPLEHRTV